MTQTVITFYTRVGCHLCEKAKAALLELQKEWEFVLEEINIDQSDGLTERYGLMIPVVLIDGEEVAFGQFDKIDIRNRLQEKKACF